MKNAKNKAAITAILTGVLILFSSVPAVFSETAAPDQADPASLAAEQPVSEDAADLAAAGSGITFDYTYDDYLSDHQGAAFPETDVPFDSSSAVLANATRSDSFEGRSGVILAQDAALLTYPVEVPEEGLYTILVTYNTMLFEKNREFKLAVQIDGETPFEAAGYLALSKLWKDVTDEKTGRFITDSRGNELTPAQLEVKGWQKRFLEDTEGYYAEPFTFYFSKGMHSVSFAFQSGGIAVADIRLTSLPSVQTYDEYLAKNSSQAIVDSDALIVLEAEQAMQKSDPVLHPRFDRSSAATSPQDPANLLLNTIGQSNWQYKGQWISWQTPEIEEAGMYRIVMRARQNYVRGVNVARKISINGEVPFKEFQNYYFPFSNRWYIEQVGDGDTEYLVYLKEGVNEIAMEVTPSYPVIVRKLQTAVFELNSTYRKIIMITGVGASGNALDEFRDYNLDKEIPAFMEMLDAHLKALIDLRAEMAQNGFEKGGEAVIVEELIRQIGSFIDDTDTIPSRLKMFKDNISAASSWVLRLKEQPLELDWIAFTAADAQIPEADMGFVSNAVFTFRAFLASFFNDYNTLDDGYEPGDAVEVWVGLGREQTQLIKQLVDDYFIPEYNIKVNINLVQQGLIPATLTGKGPDIAMFIPPSDIINLAARNALVDIQGYAGYGEVTGRFQNASMTPYTYMDKVYALPVNEAFLMMFYRKDVFFELGILPPKNWTEFYDLILVLQRSNLTIGIPGDEVTFQNLVFQHGGSYFKDNQWRETAFDSPEVLAAFKQWTEFYTKYTLPVSYDFYSRFRTGEMPLGIAAYTMYNQLSISAPEIKGLWEMVPIPGVLRDDGTVDSSGTGLGSGITMFKKTENREGAWEFMKWLTSADIQARYGREIEIIMGPAARFDTANIEAFKNLPWTVKEEEQLLSQWSNLKMIQQTPVNYYISRNLQNAFRKVVIKGDNLRETLNFYNRDINKEILRKRKEFGLD